VRAQIERALCQRFGVPHVTIVVGGGRGTLETIVASLSSQSQVILVRESGGAAQAICEYLEPLLAPLSGAAEASSVDSDDDKALYAEMATFNDVALRRRDAEFRDRLRSLLGMRGQHDAISEAELSSRAELVRRAATFASLINIYSVRADVGRSLDEAVIRRITRPTHYLLLCYYVV